VLCSKISRKLDNGSAFSFKGSYYQLMLNGKPAPAIARASVKVLFSSRIGIKAEYSGKVYCLAKIEKPIAKKYENVKTNRTNLGKKATTGHPWRSNVSDGFIYDPRNEELAKGLFSSIVAWETDSY